MGGGCGLRVLAQYVCNGCQEIDGAEPPDAALDRAGFHRKSGPASSARFGMDDGDAEAIAVVLCPDVPSLVA